MGGVQPFGFLAFRWAGESVRLFFLIEHRLVALPNQDRRRDEYKYDDGNDCEALEATGRLSISRIRPASAYRGSRIIRSSPPIVLVLDGFEALSGRMDAAKTHQGAGRSGRSVPRLKSRAKSRGLFGLRGKLLEIPKEPTSRFR
jgi:hypothetical protein